MHRVANGFQCRFAMRSMAATTGNYRHTSTMFHRGGPYWPCLNNFIIDAGTVGRSDPTVILFICNSVIFILATMLERFDRNWTGDGPAGEIWWRSRCPGMSFTSRKHPAEGEPAGQNDKENVFEKHFIETRMRRTTERKIDPRSKRNISLKH